MNDIIIRIIDFPCTDLKGVVTEDADGDYNIYLNAKYTKEQQMNTLLHEYAHIELGHLHDERSVGELEQEVKERREDRVSVPHARKG